MSIVVVNQGGTNWWQFGASVASAVGTVAAVVVALWIARRDGQRWQAKERQRDAERRDAEAAQARLVTFEVDRSGSDTEPPRMVIVNHSQQPVHDLTMVSMVGIDQQTRERFESGLVFGEVGRRGDRRASLRPYGAKDRSDLWSVSPSGWTPEGHPTAFQQWMPHRGWVGAEFECRYRFTDNTGLRWERLNNEPPTRVTDADQS